MQGVWRFSSEMAAEREDSFSELDNVRTNKNLQSKRNLNMYVHEMRSDTAPSAVAPALLLELGVEGAHGRRQGEMLFLGGGREVRVGCSTNVF